MIEIPIRSDEETRPSGGLRISNDGGEVVFDYVRYEYGEDGELSEAVQEITRLAAEDAQELVRGLKALCRVARSAESLQTPPEAELGVTIDSKWGDDQDFQIDLEELPPGVETLEDE